MLPELKAIAALKSATKWTEINGNLCALVFFYPSKIREFNFSSYLFLGTVLFFLCSSLNIFNKT